MSVARSEFGYAPYYNFDVADATHNGLPLLDLRAAASSPTMAIVHGANSASTRTGYKTTDGISWTPITSGLNTVIYSIAYGNNTFVAVGSAGVIFTSPGTDGETWTARTKFGASTAAFSVVKWDGTHFWAVQVAANVQKSTDGITWTDSAFTNTAAVNTDSDVSSWATTNYSFLSRGGATIVFTGRTANTASNRVFIAASTATTGATEVSTAFNFQYGDQDGFGIGRGPAIFGSDGSVNTDQSLEFLAYPFNRMVGINTTTTGFENSAWLGSHFYGHLFPSGFSTSPLMPSTSPVHENRKLLTYSDGWFSALTVQMLRAPGAGLTSPTAETFFAMSAQDRFVLTSTVWKDGEIKAFSNPYNGPTKTTERIIAVIGSDVASSFRHSFDISIGSKKMWICGGTITEGTIRRHPIFIFRANRAFRPVKTTIDF
jgi:hypothetical protein